MPTWGDRMTDAEIQAIVGFIRQWEATAPEVATLTRPGGGPAWRNNNTATTSSTQLFGLLPSTSNTTSHTATGQVGTTTQILDWRVLVLAGVILSIAFTLMSKGFFALKQQKE